VIYGLLAAIGWGTTDFLAAVSGRRLGSLPALAVSQLVGIVLATALFLVNGQGVASLHGLVWFLIANGVIAMVAYSLHYRALELGRSVDRASLPTDVQVSLAIAMSGARLDLGQDEAALAELEISQLDPNRAFSWSPDLFHAYAEVLEALGRDDDAATWRERAERAELALEEAQSDAELETIHIIEEVFEQEPEEDSDADSEDAEDKDDVEREGEPDDGAVSTDE